MRMVVQRRCALIESASVPRIRKSEPLEVKMMAKFVAEGAHERAEGSDFLPHRRPHPHADQHGLRIVVAEKFTRPVFADSQRSGREHADTACWCSVELRGGCQKLCTSLADTYIRPGLHCHFDGFCMREQEGVLWQVERPDPVAFEKCGTVRLAR